MVNKLERLSQTAPPWRHAQTEATLVQYAQKFIVRGTDTKEQNLAPDGASVGKFSHASAPPWMEAIVAIQKDQKESLSNDATRKSIPRRTEAVVLRTSLIKDAQPHEASDSDDDLDTDFAKAALSTGSQAFEVGNWEEADSLLQEALKILQKLSRRRRAFCDIFNLHYKLAVCAYHTLDPADAERALHTLVAQSATSGQQIECIHNAKHLLSLLYIRLNNVDRARIECEKSLQGRPRLLGEQNGASLESMALMAHIYVLLGNRARAKSCLAMIPEATRETVLTIVEDSLGADVEHLEFSSLLSRVIPTEGEAAIDRVHSKLPTSML